MVRGAWPPKATGGTCREKPEATRCPNAVLMSDMSAPGRYTLGQTKTMSGKNGNKGEMMTEEYVALSSTDECVELFERKVNMSCMGTPVRSCNEKSEDEDTKGEQVSSAMATHEIEFGEAEAEGDGVEERCRGEGEDLLCKDTLQSWRTIKKTEL